MYKVRNKETIDVAVFIFNFEKHIGVITYLYMYINKWS